VIVAETERLRLRELTEEDAAFALELVNEPDWLRYIGDRGVSTLEDARRYLCDGPIASYRKNGFGLWAVERRAPATRPGICGLIRRKELEDVDLGFAFLARFRGNGYAREAAVAVVDLAHDRYGLARLAAITLPANERSIRVLESLGFGFERWTKLAPDGEELALYARTLDSGVPADPQRVRRVERCSRRRRAEAGVRIAVRAPGTRGSSRVGGRLRARPIER
jgi:RimJ/RimL family protein N-acetyltransferase